MVSMHLVFKIVMTVGLISGPLMLAAGFGMMARLYGVDRLPPWPQAGPRARTETRVLSALTTVTTVAPLQWWFILNQAHGGC